MALMLHIVSLYLKPLGFLVFGLILDAAALRAQSVQLYSELQRIDPFGDVLALDRSASPREIISPATARNSFSSFHVAVSVPPGQTYFLYMAANPPDIVKLRLYKEQFVQRNGMWIPDTLTETTSPSFGAMPDEKSGVPNQTTRDYLLDVWTPPDAEPGRRVRIEVLLKYGTWLVAPMELRIMEATVHPMRNAAQAPLPPIDDPADSAGVHALAAHFAGLSEWNLDDAPLTVRHILRRNAQQDMALADAGVTPVLWLRAASQIVNGWTFFPNGAEWYLRVRDLLISRPRL